MLLASHCQQLYCRLCLQPPIRQSSLRQQQLDEESAAVGNEYQRRADAEWLEEIRTKASKLLSTSKATRES